ncbi:MAG: hypothetical protein IKI77_06190 [Oscillospiraceae bacterium]|nr:hypothetical protein [Oscillospiraceae bacterium]
MKDFDELIRESLLDSPETNEELNRIMIREFAKKTGRKKPRRRIAALAAAAALAMLGAAVYAASDSGFFRDRKDMFGTVTGLTYENATSEIGVSAVYAENAVHVSLDFLKLHDPHSETGTARPFVPPYSELETIQLYGNNMTLTGASGEIDCTGFDTDPAEISRGKAALVIPTGALPPGTYHLTVNAFTGGKKADAPLEMRGNWDVDFTVTEG